jgi:hypothetical protein
MSHRQGSSINHPNRWQKVGLAQTTTRIWRRGQAHAIRIITTSSTSDMHRCTDLERRRATSAANKRLECGCESSPLGWSKHLVEVDHARCGPPHHPVNHHVRQLQEDGESQRNVWHCQHAGRKMRLGASGSQDASARRHCRATYNGAVHRTTGEVEVEDHSIAQK